MKSTFALSSTLVSLAGAVLYGDEQFGDIPGGKFWVFGSNGVSIVDPDKCAVEEVIEKDATGNLLPGSWSDGVYMESKTSYYKYVVINSRVPVSDTHGEEAAHGEVLFFDAEERKVASRVIVGPRPVHSYGVFTQNQYWTHADGDGFFYIIDLEDIDAHVENPIKVHDEEPSHGKLMWDEDGLLEGTGYATSTGEPLLFIFDMETHAEVGRFNFTQWCAASHSIGFSSTNRHLYIECSRGAPTLLELDVSSPREPKYVNAHVGITGSVYETPDAKFIAVTDKGGSKFHLIQPGPIGSASSVVHSVDVYGHPSTPVFFPRKGAAKADGAANFNACLSLTVNTNQNHYGDGEVKCSYYGCSQATTQEDVDAGVCLYALDAEGKETNDLLSVSLSQINSVKGQFSPFNRACDRCANENNYDEDDQMCTCTPSCGTCASDEAADHDPNLSGSVCLDLSTLSPATDSRGLRSLRITPSSHPDSAFVAAGSVRQGSPYRYSPACGFGRTYRSHKRGGKYDVIPNDFPTTSVSVIDIEKFSLKCQVELDGRPGRVIYVPPQAAAVGEGTAKAAAAGEEESGLGVGAISGIAIGSIVAFAVVLLVASKLGGGRSDIEQTGPASGAMG